MSDPNFHISTPNLYISYFISTNPKHCSFLVHLYNTPEFIASIGGKPTTVTTPEIARTRLEGRFREEHARNGYGTYLVSLKPSSSTHDIANPYSTSESFKIILDKCKPIGSVSLMRGHYTAPDIGYAIVPEETGKGYATEAARALLNYAKETLGVDAVFGFYERGNEASRRVIQKLGFVDRGFKNLVAFEGQESAVWILPGMNEDLTVYGIE